MCTPGHTDEGYSDSHGKLLHCDLPVIIRLPILYVSVHSGWGNVQVNESYLVTCDSSAQSVTPLTIDLTVDDGRYTVQPCRHANYNVSFAAITRKTQ